MNKVDNGSGDGSPDLPQLRTEAELRALDAIKWSRYQHPVLPAWVADMDIAPPQFVVDAIIEFARSRDFGYNFAATDALIPAFCRWQTDKHGWSPDPGKVRRFCDVLHAIDVALWLHTDPGDGIVMLTPIYPPFIDAVTGVDRRIIDVPLRADDGWRLDPERLEAAIDDRTRALLLCSPHNPTGRVFDESERQAIANVVIENDLLLISDEVWADLTHPGVKHVPMELVPGLDDRTMTVTAASKAFNLAGLRCAVAHIGHPSLAKKFDSLPHHFLGAVSGPGAVASLSCWTGGTPWLEATRRYLTERRDQLARRLAADAPMIGFDSPEATYLAWLDVSAMDLGPNPSKALLDRVDIALNPGTDFGRHGEGFVRLNFATSAEILDRICDRLTAAAPQP